MLCGSLFPCISAQLLGRGYTQNLAFPERKQDSLLRRRPRRARPAVAGYNQTALYWKSNTSSATEYDLPCPRNDNMANEPGCQVRCADEQCSKARAAIHEIILTHGRGTTPHMVSPHCSLRNKHVTIKGGEDMSAKMPGSTRCERLCNGELSRVGMHLRRAWHQFRSVEP